ncbi:MAG: LysE family transporter, partial [Paracoccaceae bacterium]
LVFLAWKSARSAMKPGAPAVKPVIATGPGRAYAKGLMLHLTNPKAILFFGSLYAIGVPPGAAPADVALVFAAIGLQSAIIFHGYAILFSSGAASAAYARMRRWFDGACAAFFAFAAFKIMTARLS